MTTVSHPIHSEHHDPEHIHIVPPSYWPISLAFSVGLIPFGFLLWLWHGPISVPLMIAGGILTLVTMMGWANTLIKETAGLPDVAEDTHWMKHGLKLFLTSEAAIFGSLFAHHYYSRAHYPTWPPAGAPRLDTHLPAIATLILMSSSVTMEFAHHFLKKGHRRPAAWLTFVTIVLGVIFLGFQGHEWGFLKAYDEFTIKSGTAGSSFFAMTGFHGLHVATGLIMLMIVWVRLRLGHFDPERHFSFVAASWYWHFVDAVWIFLFFTIYLI
jgi:cytochrome c oxidase subunit III